MIDGTLAVAMKELAKTGHPRAAELVEKANALTAAVEEHSDAKKIVGAWARARRCYTECTGKSLMGSI